MTNFSLKHVGWDLLWPLIQKQLSTEEYETFLIWTRREKPQDSNYLFGAFPKAIVSQFREERDRNVRRV